MGEDAKKIYEIGKLAEDYRKFFANKPYLPSNGTEGMVFDEAWCSRCKRDMAFRNGVGEGCPILAASFRGQPKEWVHDKDGEPTCTAFAPMGGEAQ